MGDTARLIAFILLIVGTIGLLLNEFLYDRGRTATLTLAALNVIGLAILLIAYWRARGTR
jgi:hypothetical protein